MKAVILAAGKGTRLYPLTETRPKHLVPVGGKPIIDHVLMALKEAGITDVIFVVSYRKDQLQKWLGDGSRYGMKFEYSVQKQLKGTADAAKYAEPFLSKDFLLTNGDWILESKVIDAAIKRHEELTPAATMVVTSAENPEEYGVVKIENSYVTDIIEKPPQSQGRADLVNAGLYILSKDIFDAIDQTGLSPRGEFEITDSLLHLLNKGKNIAAIEVVAESMFDVGLLWDLLTANCRILSNMTPEVNGQLEESVQIRGPVQIEENARIRSGTYIEGPVFIGQGSDIGPNCYLRPFTSIGEEARIGNACEIKNSIIMNRVHIGHLSYIGDSIIGERCNFGAGTKVANYRFDGENVKMKVKNRIVDTGRRKLGAVLGDDVKTGIGALLMPGVRVGPNSLIGPNTTVLRDVPANSTVFVKQILEETRKEQHVTKS